MFPNINKVVIFPELNQVVFVASLNRFNFQQRFVKVWKGTDKLLYPIYRHKIRCIYVLLLNLRLVGKQVGQKKLQLPHPHPKFPSGIIFGGIVTNTNTSQPI